MVDYTLRFQVETYLQVCRRCKLEATDVRTYQDEVLRVTDEFVALLHSSNDGQRVKRKQRPSVMLSTHRRDLCCACQDGVCVFNGGKKRFR